MLRQGRADLALAFNRAVREGRLSAPVVISRDHHDVSGTDSPFRETTSVSDGSRFCAGTVGGTQWMDIEGKGIGPPVSYCGLYVLQTWQSTM